MWFRAHWCCVPCVRVFAFWHSAFHLIKFDMWAAPQPRYQLFGPDMDVVTAMESGGAPNAIHVSPAFAAALGEAGLPPSLHLAPDAAGAAYFLECNRGARDGGVHSARPGSGGGGGGGGGGDIAEPGEGVAPRGRHSV